MAVHNRISLPFPGQKVAEIVTFDAIPGADDEDFALVFSPPSAGVGHRPLVRVHSACATGDLFGSSLCDCGLQLREAFNQCAGEGGALLYLRQEGRGIGLKAKLDAYRLQREKGMDTFAANRELGYPADCRDYAPAAQMLKDLGLLRIRLLTNNPDKVRQLRENGIQIDEIVPTSVHINPHNLRYLGAKRDNGHSFPVIPGLTGDPVR